MTKEDDARATEPKEGDAKPENEQAEPRTEEDPNVGSNAQRGDGALPGLGNDNASQEELEADPLRNVPQEHKGMVMQLANASLHRFWDHDINPPADMAEMLYHYIRIIYEESELDKVLDEIDLEMLYTTISNIEQRLVQYVCDTVVNYYGLELPAFKEMRKKARHAATRFKNRAMEGVKQGDYDTAYANIEVMYLQLWKELYFTIVIRGMLGAEGETAAAEDKNARIRWGLSLTGHVKGMWDILGVNGFSELVLFDNVMVTAIKTPYRRRENKPKIDNQKLLEKIENEEFDESSTEEDNEDKDYKPPAQKTFKSRSSKTQDFSDSEDEGSIQKKLSKKTELLSPSQPAGFLTPGGSKVVRTKDNDRKQRKLTEFVLNFLQQDPGDIMGFYKRGGMLKDLLKRVDWRAKSPETLRKENQDEWSRSLEYQAKFLIDRGKDEKIPKFSGNREEWNRYWEQFVVLVDENPQLDVITKYKKLYDSLEGAPKELIKGFQFSAATYPAVKQRLIRRYGQEKYTITELVKFSNKFGQLKEEQVDKFTAFINYQEQMLISLAKTDPNKVETNRSNDVMRIERQMSARMGNKWLNEKENFEDRRDRPMPDEIQFIYLVSFLKRYRERQEDLQDLNPNLRKKNEEKSEPKMGKKTGSKGGKNKNSQSEDFPVSNPHNFAGVTKTDNKEKDKSKVAKKAVKDVVKTLSKELPAKEEKGSSQKNNTKNAQKTTEKKVCCFCKGSHSSKSCKMDKPAPEECYRLVMEAKLCLICLDEGHWKHECKMVCGKDGCQLKHHPTMHRVKKRD